MKKFIAFILSMTMLFSMSACSGGASSSTSSAPAIQTDSNDSVPSDTSGSSVAFEDFNSIEKICRLQDELTTEGVDTGVAPDIADVTLYIPWNTLVFYYDEYGYNDDLISMFVRKLNMLSRMKQQMCFMHCRFKRGLNI